MPQMSSLVDVRGAFLELPQGFLRRPHWLRAGEALLTASQTGRLIDIQWAFDTLVAAVDEEGWFDRRGESIAVERRPPDQTAHRPETERLTLASYFRVVGSGGGSRELRFVVEPLNLVRPIDRAADHLNGGSYFLFRRQQVPSQHSLLQCGAISQNARTIVQGRRLPGIDIDFVIVAHQRAHSSSASRFTARRGLRRRSCYQDHWRRQSREDRERFRYPIQGHVACYLPYLPSTKYNAS